MHVIDRGTVFDPRVEPSAQPIACFPSLLVCKDGTAFSAFQSGDSKNSATSTLVICRAAISELKWHRLPWEFSTHWKGAPGSLSNGELVELDDGRLMIVSTWIDRRKPKKPLYDPDSNGILPTRILQAFSHDRGESWTPWKEVTPRKVGFSYHSSGPIIRMPNGWLILALELHKRSIAQCYRFFSVPTMVCISDDQGETFSEPLTLVQYPVAANAYEKRPKSGSAGFEWGGTSSSIRPRIDSPDLSHLEKPAERVVHYWDARFAVANNQNSWMALFWTFDETRQQENNVHMQVGGFEGPHLRVDHISATTIRGQIAAPLCIHGTTWIAAVVGRTFPGTISIWKTDRGCIHWAKLLDLYTHSAGEPDVTSTTPEGKTSIAEVWENIEKWSFGHPALRKIGPNKALATWYAGTTESLAIHWAVIEFDDAEVQHDCRPEC